MENGVMTICPNDKEIVEDLVRVEKNESGISIQVAWITWLDPGHPKTHWHMVETLPVDAPPEVVEQRTQALLDNKKYFMICKECGERNPQGWMLNDDICQSCAERNHGVAF